MAHRTDYTPYEVLDERYKQAVYRHDTQWIEVVPIVVKFDRNFDEFAARVAYELRGRLLYRTDGGRNARGLVRVTGDLKTLHNLYLDAIPKLSGKLIRDGTPIKLNALLGRRQDRRATMRWVMVIRFNDSESTKFVDVDQSVIHSTPNSSKTIMARIIAHAHTVAQKMPKNDRGDHIRKMVQIADDLGYPRNWDLWIYNKEAVWGYMDWRKRAPDEETNRNSPRRRMTEATNGQFPLDGDTGFPQYIPWRIFPFRDAVQACFGRPTLDDCDASIHNQLVMAERIVDETFDVIQKRISEVDNIPTSLNPLNTTPPAANLGPLAFKFQKHLVELFNNKASLYSAWQQSLYSAWARLADLATP